MTIDCELSYSPWISCIQFCSALYCLKLCFYRITDRIRHKWVDDFFSPKEHYNSMCHNLQKIFNEYKFRICSTYLTHRGESLNKKF